eukprot:44117-Eustigmatos_ZCMA.PRE.1
METCQWEGLWSRCRRGADSLELREVKIVRVCGGPYCCVGFLRRPFRRDSMCVTEHMTMHAQGNDREESTGVKQATSGAKQLKTMGLLH